jgi:hypothetical protein
MNNICDIDKLSGIFKNITQNDSNVRLEQLFELYRPLSVDNQKANSKTNPACFFLKKDVVEIEVKLYMSTNAYYSHWVLESIDTKRENYYFTLKVLFINIRNPRKSHNDAYIENIHKNNQYRGTEIINLVLSFLRVLNVKKVRINDATRIVCGLNDENDLSLMKIIENGKSYYQRFGFKYDLSDFYLLKYGTEANVKRVLSARLKEFKKIKLDSVIKLLQRTLQLITLAMQNQDWEQLFIVIHHPSEPYYLKNSLIYETCLDIMKVYETALKSLIHYDDKYFYQVLMDSFVNDCINHKLYVEIFFGGDVYQLIYRNFRVEFKFRDCVKDIVQIRNMGLYLDL